MSAYDWNKFVRRISIKAAETDIYQAWTTQENLEKWFLSEAEFTMPNGKLRSRNSEIQADDRYQWRWFGFPDYLGEGKILKVLGSDFISFTFTGGCLVEITIKKENQETICELTQTMPQENNDEKQFYFIECGIGWTFYLTNLKSILEGGLDLRNKSDSLTNVINS